MPSSKISLPTVPCPAIVYWSSKGWTNVYLNFFEISAALIRASARFSPYSVTFAPSLFTAFNLFSGAVTGITMLHFSFNFLHASATPCAWLPAEAAIIPRAFFFSDKLTILL